MVEVLLRNWSHKSKAKGEKKISIKIANLSKKYEAKEIIYKTHWESESHYQIKRIIIETKKILMRLSG